MTKNSEPNKLYGNIILFREYISWHANFLYFSQVQPSTTKYPQDTNFIAYFPLDHDFSTNYFTILFDLNFIELIAGVRCRNKSEESHMLCYTLVTEWTENEKNKCALISGVFKPEEPYLSFQLWASPSMSVPTRKEHPKKKKHKHTNKTEHEIWGSETKLKPSHPYQWKTQLHWSVLAIP